MTRFPKLINAAIVAGTLFAASVGVTSASAAPEDGVESTTTVKVDTDSSIGSLGDFGEAGSDGSDVADVKPAGPDTALAEAEANQAREMELMALQDEPTGEPIVPQAEPDMLDIADGSGPDPLADTAPPAAEFAPEPSAAPVYNEPEPGTSSTISFADATSADAGSLPPVMQLEIDTAARSRFVDVDVAALSAGLDAETVSIQLFDDVTADLTTTIAPSSGELDSTLYAAGSSGADHDHDHDSANTDPNMAVVTIAGDYVIGQFWVDGTQYGLQTIGGVSVVYEVAREFPDGDYEMQQIMLPGPDNGPSGLTVQEREASGEAGDIVGLPAVDVMIAYDAEAAAYYGNNIDTVRANAVAMVNGANVVYRNGAQEQHMNLTHIYSTGVTPNTNSTATYRNQLASKTDGNFDGVHSTRDANGADFVVLLSNRFTATDSLCGIAFFPTSANPAENDAYNVTEASCALSGLTFIHELGHNQCAGHDNLGSNLCGYTNGRGYNDAGANKRTIMARNGTPGIRQPVYSKNGHVFSGWTHGTASFDNAAVLEVEDLGGISGGVSNYRAPNGFNQTSVAGVDGLSCIFASIDDAIATAPTGSTIYVAPGTYPAESAFSNYNIGRSMTIEQGTSQCQPTTSGAATNVVLQLSPSATGDAVVEIFGGATVRLERITIEGGNSAEGTVFVSGATATMDGVVIRNGNNPSTTVGGGGLRIASGSTVTSINNSQYVSNTAINGGGVYVDSSTFTINGVDDVRSNTATDGGGVYATNNAVVNLNANSDVLSNTASSDGGGVHLVGNADLNMSDSGTFVGFSAQGNSASRGGGVFVEFGSTGSVVTVNALAEIGDNTAAFGGGAYLGDGRITVNDDGVISSNNGGSPGNGGGILGTGNSVIDLNAGAQVVGNTGALGAGVFTFNTASLQINGDTSGGSVNPVVISGNVSTSDGGGVNLASSTTANIDTAHFVGNQAVNGGAMYMTGNASAWELSTCDAADTNFEQYCTEFRGNSATNGGAVYVSGGTLLLQEAALIDNSATVGAQALQAVGAADVDLKSVMVLGHDATVGGDGTLTAADTASLDLVAVTSADAVNVWLDLDGSATSVVNRAIATTSVLGGGTLSGACNLQSVGASGMPGSITADPKFVSTADSAFVPSAASPAVDACVDYGVFIDVLDNSVKNGDLQPSGTEYDMGAIEADPPVTVPGVPTGVSAVWLTTTSAQVSFTEPLTGGGAVTGYLAQCTSSNGGATRTKSGVSSPLTVTSLSVGKTYQCRVRAINAVGNGAFSGFVPAVVTVPGVPQAVSASWLTSSSARVSFTKPSSNGGSAVTGYFVQCSSTNGGATRTTSGVSSPLTVTSLSVGKTYQCKVRAINAVGNGAFSGFVPAVVTVPGVPQAVSASWLTTSSARVSFSAPLSNGGSAVTGYFVQCSSTNGGATRTKSGVSSPLTVTSLSVGKTYRCKVRAINAVGNGAFSGFVPAVVTVPGVPQAVSASWLTTSSARVSFSAPLSNGGSAVTGYFVQCSSTNGGATRTKSGVSSPLTVTSLSVGKTYRCKVRAINAVGNGAFSGFVPAVVTVPGVPQAVSASWLTSSSAQVSFTKPSSNGGSAITGYFVQCSSTNGGATRTKSGVSSPLTVTSLSVGKTYRCKVRAINAVGNGAFSGFVTVV